MEYNVEEKVHVKGDVENLDLRVGDYEGLVKLVKEILTQADNLPEPSISPELLKIGLQNSLQGAGQPKEVPMTPIMKAMLERNNEPTTIGASQPLTKAEQDLYRRTVERLEKVNGPKQTDYPSPENLLDKHLYDVDCWRNLKENMRDIGPGQMKQRIQMLAKYRNKPDYGPLLDKLENDNVFKKAVLKTWSIMPSVTADTEFTETSLPFDKKHSNVGYPFFHRDNVLVEKGSNVTYGQLSKGIAERITFSTLPNYNIAMTFGRNQRLKGRLIIAESRVVNLFFNRLEAREIEALTSKCPAFAGYRNASELKKVLLQMAQDAMARKFKMSNWDQSGFDVHINPVWIALVGAMRVAAAVGALGKKLAFWRAVYNIRQWVIDGMSGEFIGIWGRMPSGFIDTNQGDSWVEIIASSYCLALQDPKYFEKIWDALVYVILAMGDDCLMIYDPQFFSDERFVKDMLALGFEVNVSKYDYGAFFLQNRVFSSKGRRMVYPWTRVLKSMVFKENPRQLGTAGWLVAQLQQMSKVFEDNDALDSVVGLLAPYDKIRFGYNLTAKKVVEMIKAEDEQARKEQKPTEWRPTSEKVYDGDPQKAEQFKDGQIDEGWIATALAIVKASIDRLGLGTSPEGKTVSEEEH